MDVLLILYMPLSILGVFLYFLGNYFEHKKEEKAKLDREQQAFEAGYRDGTIGNEYGSPPSSVGTEVFLAYMNGYYKAVADKRKTKEPILTTE